MTTKPPTSDGGTIDRTTKVNMGILIVLLGTVLSGGMWASRMSTNVENMADGQRDIRDSVEGLRTDFAKSDRAIAILTTMVQGIQRQVDGVSKRVDTLESR
jgi:hypothetical protein